MFVRRKPFCKGKTSRTVKWGDSSIFHYIPHQIMVVCTFFHFLVEPHVVVSLNRTKLLPFIGYIYPLQIESTKLQNDCAKFHILELSISCKSQCPRVSHFRAFFAIRAHHIFEHFCSSRVSHFCEKIQNDCAKFLDSAIFLYITFC